MTCPMVLRGPQCWCLVSKGMSFYATAWAWSIVHRSDFLTYVYVQSTLQ